MVEADDCEDIDREGGLRGERAGTGGDEGVGGETEVIAVVVVVIGGKSTMRPERGVSTAVKWPLVSGSPTVEEETLLLIS